MSITLTPQLRFLFENQLRPLAENLRRAIVAGTSISHTITDYVAVDGNLEIDPDTGSVALAQGADPSTVLDDGRGGIDGWQQVTLGEYALLLNTLLSILQQVESTPGLMAAIERLTPNKAAQPGV